jgi:hypothetical protein
MKNETATVEMKLCASCPLEVSGKGIREAGRIADE